MKKEDLASTPDINKPLRHSSWLSRLRFLKENLNSSILYHRGVHSDQLARERLEKQLDREAKKSGALLEQLEESRERFRQLSEEFRKFQEETEKETDLVLEKCRKIEEQKKHKEEELHRLAEEFDRHKSLQDELNEARSKKILKLSLQNRGLKHAEMELKTRVEELRRRLLEREDAIKETVPMIGELKSLIDRKISRSGPGNLAGTAVEEFKNEQEASGKRSVKRWIHWLMEPVAAAPSKGNRKPQK